MLVSLLVFNLHIIHTDLGDRIFPVLLFYFFKSTLLRYKLYNKMHALKCTVDGFQQALIILKKED